MTDPTKSHLCTCGHVHKVTISTHHMHAGLVEALRIFRDVVKRRGDAGRPDWNHIRIRRDIGERLSRDQENNLSKLAFFGLLVHRRRGDWGITSKGAAFLRNEAFVLEKVRTIGGKAIGQVGEAVWARDFEKQQPDFEIDAPLVERESQQTLV